MQKYTESLVSVVIPVYNSESFLAETIESAMVQNYDKFELIIADDNSTDNSPQIINYYTKNNKNIIYIKLDKNSGPAVARNKALEKARGRYIAFLDSDDVWHQDKTKKQMKLMHDKDAAFSFTAIEMIDEDGNMVKPKRAVKSIVDYRFLLKNTMIACSSVIVDRNKTGDFRMPLLRAGQDYATWLQLLRGGTIAYGLDEAMVKYRLVSGSVSSNKMAALKKVWQVYRKCEQLSIPESVYYSTCFAYNAYKKYKT